VSQSLALAESDLDRPRGAVLVRHGKAASAAKSAWIRGVGTSSRRWLERRLELPVGALMCIITGPTSGRPWSGAAAGGTLRRLAACRRRAPRAV
jgi:hypothetical protein